LNNYFDLLAKDIKKLWNGLEFPQKLAIVALTAITAIALTYFISKSTEPNWAVLYSDLNETDAIAVVENLKKAGYMYKISDDKKSILVPSNQKEELRIMIAENDVIQDSNPGFELLDKMQLGATDFQNKLTKQRIFQGELTRTIEKIKGISKVRVQIAEPERSVFSEEDEKPTASVMVILEPGVSLKPQQVKAIKNLVAFGIPRLTPDRVFVSDQHGNVLTEEINKNSTDIESYRVNFENTTRDKVKKVLEKIVGYDNVSVQVSAVMNFDSAKATIERYIPVEGNQGILSSSQTESEVYEKGAATNTNNNEQTTTRNNPNYHKSKSFTNYNVSKEIRQVVYAPGTVNRMTIAVAINKILTEEEKQQIHDLVVSASGADTARGDIVNVTSMQFQSLDEDQARSSKLAEEMQKSYQLDFWVTKVAPLLVALILGISTLLVFASLLKKRPLEGQEVYKEAYIEEEPIEDEPELLEAVNIPVIEAKLDPELERMKVDLNNIILADPAEASRLLLSYIRD